MTLQFNPEAYLAAFKIGQENQQKNAQNSHQLFADTMGSFENLAKIPEQRKAERYKQLAAYDPALTDAANAARTEWLATGKMPLASNSLSQQNPRQDSGFGSQQPPQMASAGMPDTGWGQQQEPRGMPPMPMPQASPGMVSPMPQQGGSQQLLSSPIVVAHKDYLSKNGQGQQSQGMASLFSKKPFDPNAIIEQVRKGDYSNLPETGTKNMKILEATPAWQGVVSEAKRKQEPLTSVNKALIMFPHLKEQEAQVRQEFPNGFTDSELSHLSSGLKLTATSGEKSDQFNQREWDKIVKDVNPLTSTSRSTLGLATKADYNANRALTTLSKPVVTNQEASNVMADIASIYQGGSATEFGMSHQAYNTVYGKVQNALQQLTGKPQDAVPNDIKQRLTEVLQDMKSTNKAVIKQAFDSVEKSKAKIIKNFPNEWKDLRATYESGVAGFEQPKAGGQATHRWNPQTGQVEVIQ